MKTKPFLALFLSLCVFLPVPSQQTTDDDVVKITTNLVQVDAIVTKDGKLVSDLKAEDFEIFEDGKKQTITSFSYISNLPATSPVVTNAADRDKSVPVAPLKHDDPRRTLAIVIDDLGLSAESMSRVRSQLRKFVNEQVQPHDLIGIIRTGTQVGALQQFTNDKRLLNRAVDQVVIKCAWPRASSRIGSAGQFVAVPNLKNKQLAASGIVLRGVADLEVDMNTTEVAGATPAVRRFFPNTDLYFAVVVYNAVIDPALRRPNLEIESKLFRDDKRVYSYPGFSLDPGAQPDLERIFVSQVLRLGANLEPGHYYLQLAITDKSNKDKEQPPVIQWVDFEIVK